MSRVRLNPREPAHEVVVGLDPPLATFFAQVFSDGEPLEFRPSWSSRDVVEVIDRYAADDERTRAVRRAVLLDLDPADHVSGEDPP